MPEPRTASTPFGVFNQDLLAALLANVERFGQVDLIAKHAARLIEKGGHLMRVLPLHFLFDVRDFADISAAGMRLLEIQGKILRHLARAEGRDGVLARFRVPEAMRRLVDWEQLLNGEQIVARFDILETQDGYVFCEFNVDSSVSGAEIFDFMTDYFATVGIPVRDRLKTRSPLEDLGAFHAEVARRKNLTRIVLLDWSVGGGSATKGYFSFDDMRDYVAGEVHPIPVLIADEKTYDPRWLEGDEARKTLVHRLFLFEEMDDGGAFLARLHDAGTTVINTYDSEIRNDKGWFGLFHDERLRQLLSEEERAVIDRYIPYTSELTPANRAALIANKDEYIFKEKLSFGGAGVRVGQEISTEELEELVSSRGIENWIAQRNIRTISTALPHDEKFAPEPHNLVFALYLYGSRPNGMWVRASRSSKVVNLTSGAGKAAWAACTSAELKAELVAGLQAER